MSDEFALEVPPELVEAIARRAAELVVAELGEHEHDEEPPYLTVAQYAALHQTTAAAVRARIRRGKLTAIRPPGSREYLIANGPESVAATVPARSNKCARDAATSGRVTPKE